VAFLCYGNPCLERLDQRRKSPASVLPTMPASSMICAMESQAAPPTRLPDWLGELYRYTSGQSTVELTCSGDARYE
jgi:hypothetical protein